MELPNIEERRSPHSREIEDDILKPTKEKLPESKEFKEESIIKNIEPVFIRIDKFEESLRIFEKVKKDILEIEKMLKDIKTLKEHESRELSHWEREMQRVKDQIDQVDKDIFSKIE